MPYDIFAVKGDDETLVAEGWPARGYAAASASKWIIDSQFSDEPVECFHIRNHDSSQLVVVVTEHSILYK